MGYGKIILKLWKGFWNFQSQCMCYNSLFFVDPQNIWLKIPQDLSIGKLEDLLKIPALAAKDAYNGYSNLPMDKPHSILMKKPSAKF